jgi:hypothetical protein
MNAIGIVYPHILGLNNKLNTFFEHKSKFGRHIIVTMKDIGANQVCILLLLDALKLKKYI